MEAMKFTVDHIHLISSDPSGTAAWYSEMFGAQIVKRGLVRGASQIAVSFGDFLILVRGERPDENASEKPGLTWGVDHFGLTVGGDFDAFCAKLQQKGVVFSLNPTNINPETRIAFINAPDRVSVELVSRAV